MTSDRSAPNRRPIGYLFLQERYSITCLSYWVESFVVSGGRMSEPEHGLRREFYPEVYWPGDTEWDHLEFAFKHEGLNLPLLRAFLPQVAPQQIGAYVRERPRSEYRRRLWYLYEQMTGRVLDIPDVRTGNYAELLDREIYYAGTPKRSPRQRVVDNLPGTIGLSPMVRRTQALRKFEAERLEDQCKKVISEIPPEVYSRALDFLYVKETKSSYAIERETPNQKRAQKFVDTLREAAKTDSLQEPALVRLQNTIVDPRFKNNAWRTDQNYVGRSLASGDEEVHFIPPRPEDVRWLMDEYLAASRQILESDIHPVVAAAMIAFAFVFLHPFGDGNGRCHRFLIHYVLARRGFAPEGVIFPVSAIMLHRMTEYDRSLESFSKPLVRLIEYKLDRQARLTVQNETANFYRYIDCTVSAEILFSFVKETIQKELPAEVRYLRQYDEARARMREIVDLPNRNADLFIRFCRQNSGRLGKSRRKDPEYALLSDQEIAALEKAVRDAFEIAS